MELLRSFDGDSSIVVDVAAARCGAFFHSSFGVRLTARFLPLQTLGALRARGAGQAKRPGGQAAAFVKPGGKHLTSRRRARLAPQRRPCLLRGAALCTAQLRGSATGALVPSVCPVVDLTSKTDVSHRLLLATRPAGCCAVRRLAVLAQPDARHVGDAGCDKFGEKLIRAALLRTPEWQSANSAGFSRELGALGARGIHWP